MLVLATVFVCLLEKLLSALTQKACGDVSMSVSVRQDASVMYDIPVGINGSFFPPLSPVGVIAAHPAST